MLAIIVGLLAGLAGLLIAAAATALGPVLDLRQSIAVTAAKAKAGRVSARTRTRSGGDGAEIGEARKEGSRAEEHRLAA